MLAGGGGSGKNKDAGPDYRTDAQGGQGPGAEAFLEPVFRLVSLGDQLVDRLPGKELGSGQKLLPG